MAAATAMPISVSGPILQASFRLDDAIRHFMLALCGDGHSPLVVGTFKEDTTLLLLLEQNNRFRVLGKPQLMSMATTPRMCQLTLSFGLQVARGPQHSCACDAWLPCGGDNAGAIKPCGR